MSWTYVTSLWHSGDANEKRQKETEGQAYSGKAANLENGEAPTYRSRSDGFGTLAGSNVRMTHESACR
jgi:hypothetical protein